MRWAKKAVGKSMGRTIYFDDLSRGIKAGDIGSFERLYRLMGRKIFLYAYSFLPCREDAEEIVHDVFIKIWEGRFRLNDNKSLQSYIYTIAKNATLDKIRKYNVDQLNLVNYFKNNQMHDFEVDEQQNAKLLELVRELVEGMPYQRRKVFKLNKFDGMSQKSISEYLNISQGTVEKHISKAIQYLKDELEKKNVSILALPILVLFI